MRSTVLIIVFNLGFWCESAEVFGTIHHRYNRNFSDKAHLENTEVWAVNSLEQDLILLLLIMRFLQRPAVFFCVKKKNTSQKGVSAHVYA